MDRKAKYTMKDIAELAEVSRATVDRVIHGRGKVSKHAYEKIKIVLDAIDYKPNIIARSLQKSKSHRIAVLLPDYEFDIFWKSALEGIDETLKSYEFIGLVGDKYLFNPFKTASFKYNSRLILEEEYDAVLLAPVFLKESLEYIFVAYSTKNYLILHNYYLESLKYENNCC
jgi:LacI family transcriptional regulator